MMRVAGQVWLWVGCALLAACASTGPEDNPFVRSATWFSYVGGDDLRVACTAGSPDRYRLVYNGNYKEQRRTYDLVADADANSNSSPGPKNGASVEGHVRGEVNLASGVPLLDPLAPWRGLSFTSRMEPEWLHVLRTALAAAEPPPKGLLLPSDSFYWTAAVCEGGVFRFYAWTYPSPAYDALTFVDAVLASDTSGAPFNKAREITYFTLRDQEGYPPNQDRGGRFVLKVGDNGLAAF